MSQTYCDISWLQNHTHSKFLHAESKTKIKIKKQQRHEFPGLWWQVMFSHLCGEIAISAQSQITQLFIVDAGALTLPLWGWRRVCLSLSVRSTPVCVCVRVCESTTSWRWTADMPHHTGREERRKKRKRSCHKHGNQSSRKREVRIKEQKEKRQGISSLIFSVSQPHSLQSSWAQVSGYKRGKKAFFKLQKKKIHIRGVHPFCTGGHFKHLAVLT